MLGIYLCKALDIHQKAREEYVPFYAEVGKF